MIKSDLLEWYIEQNFNVDGAEYLVRNIIRYVAIQGLSKDDTIDMLLCLFDDMGITKKELSKYIE